MSESAGLLLSSESYEELLQSAAELSVRTIAGVTISGITLSQDGHVLTVASADELAGLLDEQQYERDEGPCLQALYTGEVVEAVDLTVGPGRTPSPVGDHSPDSQVPSVQVEHRRDDTPLFDIHVDRRPCFRAPRAMISVCGAGAT
ncbi:MAG: hypothetical protein LH603_10975 [Pseudonocardia sp.]|nr:hypothetical protein [Pseudonocardia sp.]